MVLRLELPEGQYIADVGFGLLTLTAPLFLEAEIEQRTPHGLHRLVHVGDEFQLQVKLVEGWAPIYQLVQLDASCLHLCQQPNSRTPGWRPEVRVAELQAQYSSSQWAN
jgi:arylamine N-acetyltransferase